MKGNISFLMCLCTAALGCLPAHLVADQVILTPVADTSISEYAPTNNLGGHTHLVVGTTLQHTHNRGLLRFNIGGQVPATATITNVRLMIRVIGLPVGGGRGSVFDLHRVLQPWGEGNKTGNIGSLAGPGEATWRARMAPDQLWSQPGGAAPTDFVDAVSSSIPIAGLGIYTFPTTQTLIDDVQGWLNQPQSNFGWMIISESEYVVQTARRIGTREIPANAATLELEYTVPPPTPPAITAEPQSVVAKAGTTASFNVQAFGTAPLQYQWQFNGETIAGATNATLQLDNVQPGDAGDYQALVSNTGGTATSQTATLTVLTPPQFTVQPLSQSAPAGTTVTFSVAAIGSEPLQYQWQFNGTVLPNVAGPTLTIENVQPGDAGVYQAVVHNDVGSAPSQTATLTVLLPPSITSQPQDVSERPGAIVIFNVTASGSPPLHYQWNFNGNPVPGATGSSLTLNNVQSGNAGTYQVLVSNTAGTAASRTATLTVLSAPAFTSIHISSGEVTLEFQAQAGVAYRIEYTDGLPAVAWQTLTTVNGAAGTQVARVSDAIGPVARFYRIMVP